MFDKYCTTEQLQQLKQRASTFGEDKMHAYQNDWQKLIDLVRVEMEKGTDPNDERVGLLAQRWYGLVQAFTGGDPSIAH